MVKVSNPCSMFHAASGALIFFSLYISFVLYYDLSTYVAVWPMYKCTPLDSYVMTERKNTYWVYVPVEVSNGTSLFNARLYPFRTKIRFFYSKDEAEDWGSEYELKKDSNMNQTKSYECYYDETSNYLYVSPEDKPDEKLFYRIIGWGIIIFVFLVCVPMLCGICGYITKLYLGIPVSLSERRSALQNKSGYGSI